MRTFLAAAVLMVAALPASAEECATVEFDWAKGPASPKMIDRSMSDTVLVDLVGEFLNVQVGGVDSSVEVPFGAVTATACAEGVSFTLAETALTVEPVAEILDLMPDEWARFIEPLTFGVH